MLQLELTSYARVLILSEWNSFCLNNASTPKGKLSKSLQSLLEAACKNDSLVSTVHYCQQAFFIIYYFAVLSSILLEEILENLLLPCPKIA